MRRTWGPRRGRASFTSVASASRMHHLGTGTTVLLNLILASSRSTKFSTAVFWPLKSMFLRILQLY